MPNPTLYLAHNLPHASGVQSLPSRTADLIYIHPPFNTRRTQIHTIPSQQGDHEVPLVGREASPQLPGSLGDRLWLRRGAGLKSWLSSNPKDSVLSGLTQENKRNKISLP